MAKHNALKAWLKDEHRSQQWLADKVRRMDGSVVHQTTVSQWCLGTPIPLHEALQISRLTGLSLDDLADQEDPNRPTLQRSSKPSPRKRRDSIPA
jgi:hypothetical protein